MRQLTLIGLGLSATLALAGCQKATEAEVERVVEAINAVDEANMNDIMLTMADPAESVAYFSKKAAEDPKRIDFQRGWAISLVRAKRSEERAAATETQSKALETQVRRSAVQSSRARN